MKLTHHITYILISIFALTMSSCVTNYTTRYLQKIDKDYGPYVEEEYRLKPQDEISICLFTTDNDASKLFNGGAQSNGANMVSYRPSLLEKSEGGRHDNKRVQQFPDRETQRLHLT